MANDEAGPLNGTVWPILIAVAVTPGPFCCSAAPAGPAIASRPANNTGAIALNNPRYCRKALGITDDDRISSPPAARRKCLRNAIGILNSAHRSVVASHADVEAAVDAEVLAGDIGRGVRQQEADGFHDFIGLSPASHRNLRQYSVAEFVAANHLRHRSFDDAEADRIGADVEFAPFAGRGHGQAEHAGLGGGIIDLPDRSLAAGVGGNIDNRTAALVTGFGTLNHVAARRLQPI